MIWTKLHWIDGPWPGKLALAARPRGGDWLDDEIESWRREGIATVFSSRHNGGSVYRKGARNETLVVPDR